MAVIDTTEHAPAVTAKTTSAPPGHYRAAVVHDFSSRLTIDEIPRPVLEPGQILVEVEATVHAHLLPAVGRRRGPPAACRRPPISTLPHLVSTVTKSLL